MLCTWADCFQKEYLRFAWNFFHLIILHRISEYIFTFIYILHMYNLYMYIHTTKRIYIFICTYLKQKFTLAAMLFSIYTWVASSWLGVSSMCHRHFSVYTIWDYAKSIFSLVPREGCGVLQRAAFILNRIKYQLSIYICTYNILNSSSI